MTRRKKQPRKKLSEEEIDAIVEAQAADDSAWGKPIQVRKGKAAKMLLVREADRVGIAQRFYRWDSVPKSKQSAKRTVEDQAGIREKRSISAVRCTDS